MTRPLIAALPLLALAAAAGLPGAASAAPDDGPFYRRAAACVAVLERDAQAMAGRHHAGERGLKPALVTLTEQGFAFIGTAYLRGLRKAEADRLVDEAEAAQRQESPEALARLSAGCRAEGARLYASANGLERALVSNRAKARVERLLAKRG